MKSELLGEHVAWSGTAGYGSRRSGGRHRVRPCDAIFSLPSELHLVQPIDL